MKPLTLSHILLLSLTLRLLVLLTLGILPRFLKPFDNSHLLLSLDAPGTLRWDAIHFTSIALNGYKYEQQLAFMPGFLYAMRYAGNLVGCVLGREVGVREVVCGGVGVNVLATLGSTAVLYRMTHRHSSKEFAAIICLLYSIPPTPAVLASPYTEPLFALFTFLGFDLALRRRYLLSALSLAAATSVRATGVLGAVVVCWLVVLPRGVPTSLDFRPTRFIIRTVYAALLAMVVALPFTGFQYFAYRSFCLPTPTRPWCSSRIPMAYSFVQKGYWNNGLLNYWTVAQLPNLIIALPVLIPSLWGTWRYFRDLFRAQLPGYPSPYQATARTDQARPVCDPRLLPLQLQHLLLTLLLIFASHTQIALRVAVTDPVVWWNVASLSFDWTKHRRPTGADSTRGGQLDRRKATKTMTRFGKLWVTWVLVWGALSIVLWSAHLPPA